MASTKAAKNWEPPFSNETGLSKARWFQQRNTPRKQDVVGSNPASPTNKKSLESQRFWASSFIRPL
ncbi:MAG: hypothetical protein ACLTZQ_08130, partial [Bifidobacterium longum]